eukprot:12612547-Ditylum_brightwellii.AAC.1
MAGAVNTLTNQAGCASDSSASNAGGGTLSSSSAPHLPLHAGAATSVAYPGRGPISSVPPTGTLPPSSLPPNAPSSSATVA